MGDPPRRSRRDQSEARGRTNDLPFKRRPKHTPVRASATFAAVQRTKGDRRAMKRDDLPLLQMAVGNSATAALLQSQPDLASPTIQRHSISGAPPRPVSPEEDTAVQGDWTKTAPSSKSSVGTGPKLGTKRAPPPLPKWVPGAKTGPIGAPQGPKVGTRLPILGAVAFTKPQLDADGTSTGKALVTNAPTRKVNWTIEGDGAGSTIDATGLITSGTDLKGKENTKVQVKATDALSLGAHAIGTFELWDPKILAATKDLSTFLGKGPYVHPDFKSANGFGKFDASYDPSARLLTIGMRLRFEFPDDTNSIFTRKKKRDERLARQTALRDDFINQVTTAWSGKFAFENVREPKSVWGRLNPVQVAVKVEPTTKKDQHFLVNMNMNTEDTANVSSSQVTSMYKGDLTPKEAFTKASTAGELSRIRQVAPPVLFKKGTCDFADGSQETISFLATYLNRLHNPKINLEIRGSAADQDVADKRAVLVQSALAAAGLGGPHTMTTVGVKKAQAVAFLSPSIAPDWKNVQDVTAHEFGHMLGLDDEYEVGGNKGKGIETYDRVKDALGTKYADVTSKAGVDSASVMDGGSDVRIQHYITFWDLLGQLTTKKAPVPDPRFGDADWKFIG